MSYPLLAGNSTHLAEYDTLPLHGECLICHENNLSYEGKKTPQKPSQARVREKGISRKNPLRKKGLENNLMQDYCVYLAFAGGSGMTCSTIRDYSPYVDALGSSESQIHCQIIIESLMWARSIT